MGRNVARYMTKCKKNHNATLMLIFNNLLTKSTRNIILRSLHLWIQEHFLRLIILN